MIAVVNHAVAQAGVHPAPGYHTAGERGARLIGPETAALLRTFFAPHNEARGGGCVASCVSGVPSHIIAAADFAPALLSAPIRPWRS